MPTSPVSDDFPLPGEKVLWLCLVCGTLNEPMTEACAVAACGARRLFPGPYSVPGRAPPPPPAGAPGNLRRWIACPVCMRPLPLASEEPYFPPCPTCVERGAGGASPTATSARAAGSPATDPR